MVKSNLALKLDDNKTQNTSINSVGEFQKKTRGNPNWKAGQSANPAGRTAIPPDIKEMLKKATPKAFKLLIDTINDDKVKHDLRLKAADSILDRVYGKATQPIDSNIDNLAIPESVRSMTLTELKSLLGLENK